MFENQTLEDVEINAESNYQNLYVGSLFGYARDETYIRNIKVLNANINVVNTYEDSNYTYVGLVTGRFFNAMTAEYIYSSGSINVTGHTIYAGGSIGGIGSSYKLNFLRNDANVHVVGVGDIIMAGVIGWDFTIGINLDVYGLENYGSLTATEGYQSLILNELRNKY